ncbi:hypothetical protein LAZ67_23000748 [Cordylochernes scorpioides]|uniref:PiggyBac transposable element-derived protein domain-containing protein n=1 Tax=Cordylochernes scorpioides TaxID=51811 RepID=A0ABY6LSP6_9ARAC|nr:hypothetical protein LAZ67_23000748 [Cordylochernes scorpioides]
MTEKELIKNISRLILDESEDSEEEFGLSDEDSDNCYESNHNSESEQDVISSGSEDEGEEYLGKNGHVWSSKEPIKTRTKSSNIVVRCPGPKASLQIPKASDAFNLYFDDNTINVITKWTNQKIDTVKGNYKFRTFTYETSPDEIRALIGLTLLAGVGKGGSESTKSLFARDGTGRNIFGAGMNERCFVFLLNVLRFDNRESREERRKDDKLAPIRELWELFIAKCSSLYSPGTNCTIDESLLNFRGRCGFKQYIPNKPAKYGIKVFVLADSATYYFLTGKIYIGKDSNYDPNFSVPTNVVLELVKPIENTNRNITTDNWYTSYELAMELKKRNITLVGTLKKNKAIIPKNFLLNGDIGVSQYGFDAMGVTILSYVPKQKKRVILLSSMHHEKYTEKDSNKPEIIVYYNYTKGGVDTHDQLCANYTCKRKTARWPMRVFFGMVDSAAYNSLVLYSSVNKVWASEKSNRRSNFIKELAIELITPHAKHRYSIPQTPKAIRNMIELCGLVEIMMPSQSTSQKRARCYLCPRSNDTKYKIMCSKCKNVVCPNHSFVYCQKCN